MARSNITPHVILGVIVLTTAASACGDPSSRALASVRDSAGIQIVESSAPQWADGEGWTLSADPILEIGVSDGDDPYLFDRVRGVVRFEDGTLVVGNTGDRTVRYYDSTGAHLYTTGGSGEGPGEFNQMRDLIRFGDGLLGQESRGLPGKVFDRQGNLVGTVQLPALDGGTALIGMFDDGTLLMTSAPQGHTFRDGVALDSVRVHRSSLDYANADTIEQLPRAYYVEVQFPFGRRGLLQQYGPQPSWAVSDAEWYYGWPEDQEIQQLDKEGQVQRLIRRTWEPVPVTSQDVQRHHDEILSIGPLPPQAQAQVQAVVDGMVYPEYHPAFERIEIDPAGNLWVERADPSNPREPRLGALRDAPTIWDVFDPDGVWLGPVEFPGRFWAWEIGEGYVAGVWSDEVDVERVRVYGLGNGR